MTKVTLKEMCDQLGKISPSRLDFNVANFATEVGQYSKRVFKKSFDTQSFDGKAWKPRESRWGKRFTHPILNDTGTLKDSFPIVEGNDFASSTSRKDASARRSDGKLPFKRISASYTIHTNEKSQVIRGKRGAGRKSIGYAAIHNTDPRISPYTVNQYSFRKPVQRQFIGFNREIDDYVNNNLIKDVLLKGFPT